MCNEQEKVSESVSEEDVTVKVNIPIVPPVKKDAPPRYLTRPETPAAIRLSQIPKL